MTRKPATITVAYRGRWPKSYVFHCAEVSYNLQPTYRNIAGHDPEICPPFIIRIPGEDIITIRAKLAEPKPARTRARSGVRRITKKSLAVAR